MKDAASLSGQQKSEAGGRTKSETSRLWQIVNLQADRIGAGSLDGVDPLYHVSVFQGAGCFNEYSPLDALILREIRRRLHPFFVSMLFLALLKCLQQRGSQVFWLVNRTHYILVQLDLQVRRTTNGDDQRQRIRLQLADAG